MAAKGVYQLYTDSMKQWRWRYVASNGRTIGVSSEAYINKSDCKAAIALMQGSGGDPIVET